MEIERPVSKQPIPAHAKRVFTGKLFDVYQWEQDMYDGSTATFEKRKRPDTVIVYAVLPDGNIMLTKQEQPGKKAIIGAAGGRGADYRGWEAGHPTSKIDWVVYTFIAKGLKRVADMHLDAGEKIELMPVSFDKFLEIASDPDFIEQETVMKVLEARLDPEKLEELRVLFSA